MKSEKNNKSVNVRIAQSSWDFLLSHGGTAGGALKAILQQAEQLHQQGNELFMIGDNLSFLQQIRRYSTNELKGMFTPNEWKYMADSLNGTMITVEFRCNPSALNASIEDSDRCDGMGAKWEVNVPELISKVKKLTGAQTDAVFTRISEFWYGEDKDMEEWAKW